MPRPLYTQGKSPFYQLDTRLGGLQSRSGSGGEEKNSQPLPGLEPPIIQPVAQRYTTELSRLTKWKWVVSFTPLPIYLWGKALCIHGVGGWVGPRAVLDAVSKRKSHCPCRDSNPSRPARSLITMLTELYKKFWFLWKGSKLSTPNTVAMQTLTH
jgi:hypothetical protein